jgi:hypothetical protein
MSDVSYPGNSQKKKQTEEQKANREPLKKAITGEVVQRKESLGSKLAASFKGDDSRTVGQYILFEVAVPAFKQFISDAGREALDRLLYGNDAGPRRSSGSGGGRTNYGGMAKSSRRDEPARALSQRARASHDFSEIILAERPDAEKVLDDLRASVDQYGSCTVSDLYSLVGITGAFTDDLWGWYDLRDARIRRVRNGYLLELPRTESIE